ncbi:MAG: ABC transporter permease [Halioglobus sp.]
MTFTRFLSLVDIQARMSLRADASRFFLGYIWWFLEPLLFVLIFYFIFDIVLESGRSDFLLFLICGNLPFMWFASSVSSSALSILVSKGLVGQIDIPKAIFPMAKIQEGLYKQAAVFLLLIAIVVSSGVAPSLHWLWLFPLIVTEYLIIVTCSLVGAMLVCFAKDFTLLISLTITFLMFVSGVFWDVRTLPNPEFTELFLLVNPLAFLFDGFRQVLLYNQPLDVAHLARLLVVCLVAAALVLGTMSRLDRVIATRVLAE